MKKSLQIIIIIIVIALLVIAWQSQNKEIEKVTSFEENIGNQLEKKDLIRVTTPRPNDVIKSPLKITGEARGYWFFEASFPIVLLAQDGTVLLESYIMTENEWMTEDFVSFAATFQFEKPENIKSGTLILKKDNPSGLPEHDDNLVIPIFFE